MPVSFLCASLDPSRCTLCTAGLRGSEGCVQTPELHPENEVDQALTNREGSLGSAEGRPLEPLPVSPSLERVGGRTL